MYSMKLFEERWLVPIFHWGFYCKLNNYFYCQMVCWTKQYNHLSGNMVWNKFTTKNVKFSTCIWHTPGNWNNIHFQITHVDWKSCPRYHIKWSLQHSVCECPYHMAYGAIMTTFGNVDGIGSPQLSRKQLCAVKKLERDIYIYWGDFYEFDMP